MTNIVDGASLYNNIPRPFFTSAELLEMKVQVLIEEVSKLKDEITILKHKQEGDGK